MAKRIKVVTSNKEIYQKFNSLNFVNEVILNDAQETYVKKILKSINKYDNILDMEVIGKRILVKKNMRTSFDIYLRS